MFPFKRVRPQLTLIFSNISSSSQYLNLILYFSRYLRVHVIFIGDHASSFGESLKKHQDRFHVDFIDFDNSRSWTHLKVISGLFKIFSRTLPTKIVASGQIGAFYSCLLSKIFLQSITSVRHHADEFIANHNRKNQLVDILISKFSTRIICVSETVRSVLLSQGVPFQKTLVIHNSFSIPFDQGALKIPRGAGSNFQNILIVARHMEWKGIDYAIQGFAKYLNTGGKGRLTLIGNDGPFTFRVIEELAKLPKNSFALERNWSSSMESIYNSHDTIIHVPTRSHAEAFGLVYLESLAFGLKCIFTLSGIVHELIDFNQYFIIVPYKDSNSIAYALHNKSNQTLTEPRIRNRLLKEFSEDRMFKSYHSAIFQCPEPIYS